MKEIDGMTAADRIRNALAVPSSLMGGQSFVMDTADIREMLEENERLRIEIEVAIDGIESAYSCLPTDQFPGPPNSILTRLRAALIRGEAKEVQAPHEAAR